MQAAILGVKLDHLARWNADPARPRLTLFHILLAAVARTGQGRADDAFGALRYVASPVDAMQLLVMRRVDHALLAEPAASMALRKTGSFPLSVIAPELHRSVDLQQEWGRVFARAARIPQAGIAVMGALRERPELVARIEAEYARSLAWCKDNAEVCGKAVAARIDLLSPEAVTDSIAVSQLEAVSVADARAELEFMFGKLVAKNPALVGGKLPDEGFYAGATKR